MQLLLSLGTLGLYLYNPSFLTFTVALVANFWVWKMRRNGNVSKLKDATLNKTEEQYHSSTAKSENQKLFGQRQSNVDTSEKKLDANVDGDNWKKVMSGELLPISVGRQDGSRETMFISNDTEKGKQQLAKLLGQ